MKNDEFQKLVLQSLGEIHDRISDVDERLNTLNGQVVALETQLMVVDDRLDTVVTRLDTMDTRLDAIVTRLNTQDADHDMLTGKVDRLSSVAASALQASEQALTGLTGISRRVTALED